MAQHVSDLVIKQILGLRQMVSKDSVNSGKCHRQLKTSIIICFDDYRERLFRHLSLTNQSAERLNPGSEHLVKINMRDKVALIQGSWKGTV